MGKFIPDRIRNKLETTIQSAGKTFPPTKPRQHNILWIKNLSREGLSYGTKEKQLMIHTTKIDEKIFIQYPGKESREYTQNGRKRKDTAIRPWDFRPELYFANNRRHKNMSFGNIWASIFETVGKLSEKNKEEILRLFCTLLYRMAFMLDHNEVEYFDTHERDAIYNDIGNFEIFNEREIRLPTLFKYTPDKEVVEHIVNICPKWGEISFEAFLIYNDLLSWNEDCKYYYRNYHVRSNEKWIGSTGRVNTLCSHIRILGSMLGDVELADIFNDFANQRGVSPASKEEVIKICGGFVKDG